MNHLGVTHECYRRTDIVVANLLRSEEATVPAARSLLAFFLLERNVLLSLQAVVAWDIITAVRQLQTGRFGPFRSTGCATVKTTVEMSELKMKPTVVRVRNYIFHHRHPHASPKHSVIDILTGHRKQNYNGDPGIIELAHAQAHTPFSFLPLPSPAAK